MHVMDRDVVLRGTHVTFDLSAVRLPEMTQSILQTDVQVTLQPKMKMKKKEIAVASYEMERCKY